MEYDGEWVHRDRVEQDQAKTLDLIAAGWKVLRLREAPLVLINAWDLEVLTNEEVGSLTDKIIKFLVSNGCIERETKYQHLPMYQGWREQADDPWYEGYEILKRYEMETGDCSQNHPVLYDDFRLRQWVGVQRRSKKRGRLSERKIALLSGLRTWKWATMPQLHLGWEEAYRRLVEYYDREGEYPVDKYKSVDGFHLGGWATNQRAHRRNGQLTPEREARLSSLPNWNWNPLRANRKHLT